MTCNIRIFLLSLSSLIVFTSCEDKFTESFKANVPVYKSLAEWRAESVEMEAPRDLHQPGKIYRYRQYLIVNENFRGLHFIDNSDPSNPVKLGFLPVLGNVDMAIRNDQLYVDAYMDLLTFDISDLQNPNLVCRRQNVFEDRIHDMPQGYDPELPLVDLDPARGIIVDWKIEKVTRDLDTDNRIYHLNTTNSMLPVSFNQEVGPSHIGTGGSMARFTIAGEYLYTLETNELTTYSLANKCPESTNNISLNRTAETIFPADNHLFLGTTTGMVIYTLSNPGNPTFVSDYNHINACDPVVVAGNRAYVTLRSGNTCFGTVNRLIVVDISDITKPEEISFYNMTNPHGLGIDQQVLFVCDGPDGLKVFDASDDHNILQNEIARYQQIDAYDVIPYGGVLISVAADGIRQYDYSDPNQIIELSHIPVL